MLITISFSIIHRNKVDTIFKILLIILILPLISPVKLSIFLDVSVSHKNLQKRKIGTENEIIPVEVKL